MLGYEDGGEAEGPTGSGSSGPTCRVMIGGIPLKWVRGCISLAVQDVCLRVGSPGAAIYQAGEGERGRKVILGVRNQVSLIPPS